MIRTIWDSKVNLPAGSPPYIISNLPSETGILHQAIDLNQVQMVGDVCGVEVHLTANAVAPGTPNVTLSYAFSSRDNITPTELLPAAAQLTCAVPNLASAMRAFSAAVVYQGSRYLHIWFDHDAIPQGATITVRALVNAKQS